MYSVWAQNKACAWTFHHKSWPLCLLLWCLPGFITISLYWLSLYRRRDSTLILFQKPSSVFFRFLHFGPSAFVLLFNLVFSFLLISCFGFASPFLPRIRNSHVPICVQITVKCYSFYNTLISEHTPMVNLVPFPFPFGFRRIILCSITITSYALTCANIAIASSYWPITVRIFNIMQHINASCSFQIAQRPFRPHLK